MDVSDLIEGHATRTRHLFEQLQEWAPDLTLDEHRRILAAISAINGVLIDTYYALVATQSGDGTAGAHYIRDRGGRIN